MTEMKIKLLTVFNLAWGQQKDKTGIWVDGTKSYRVRQLVHKRLGRLPWWFSGEDCASKAGSTGSISSWGTKIPYTARSSQRKQNRETSDFLDNVGQGTHKGGNYIPGICLRSTQKVKNIFWSRILYKHSFLFFLN